MSYRGVGIVLQQRRCGASYGRVMDPAKYGIFAEETEAESPATPGSTRRDWVLREIALLGLVDDLPPLDIELPPER